MLTIAHNYKCTLRIANRESRSNNNKQQIHIQMLTDCFRHTVFQPFKLTKCMHFSFTRHAIDNQGHITFNLSRFSCWLWLTYKKYDDNGVRELKITFWNVGSSYICSCHSTFPFDNTHKKLLKFQTKLKQNRKTKKEKKSKNKIIKRWKISHICNYMNAEHWTLNTMKMSRLTKWINILSHILYSISD